MSVAENMLIINGLGSFDNEYGPKPPAPRDVISPEALSAARQSGMTAINVTLDYREDFEDTIESLGKWSACIRRHSQELTNVFSATDITRANAEGRIGVIYGLQNAAMTGARVERVDTLADLGVRVIQLTYNEANQLGGGCMAQGDPGLLSFGREVIDRLNARRVMVDLSHSGHQLCLDAIRASKQPVSINHTGCRAIADLPRNKTDEELRLVAESGGYVGIYFIMYLAQGRAATIDDVIAHLDHAIEVCGEDHVGFGSDYGIVDLGDMKAQWEFWAKLLNERAVQGSAATGEDPHILPFATGLIGPNQFRDLATALERHGYASGRVEKVMGANFLRHAREVWGR